jgi:predicted nucleic acid-binding protein
MLLIDANIIIYSRGAGHDLKQPSNVTLHRVRDGHFDANVNTEVLQEILNYYHRKDQGVVGGKIFDDLIAQFPDPYPIRKGTVIRARELLDQYTTLQTRDAIHAAVVFEHNLEGIISADRAFDRVKGLKRFDPKELAA